MGKTLLNNLQGTGEQKERGHSSRTKKILIAMAIEACKPEDKYNRYKVCEKLADIMEEKYTGEKLEYHSTRMGMDTTKNMLKEIDAYFYKYVK